MDEYTDVKKLRERFDLADQRKTILDADETENYYRAGRVVVRRGIPDDLVIAMFEEQLTPNERNCDDVVYTVSEKELLRFVRNLLAVSVGPVP
jgi:hypothetical protein